MDSSAMTASLFPDDPTAKLWVDTMRLDPILVQSPREGHPLPQFAGHMHSTRTLAATWVRTGESLNVGWDNRTWEWELAGILKGHSIAGSYFWRSDELGMFRGSFQGSRMQCPSF
jgi:hypothetical protein